MAYENADGKISRLYTNPSSCRIRLDTHGDRYFKLEVSHPNYQAIHAQLLAAAINRYKIRLRLKDYEPPTLPSDDVLYIVLDW